VRTLIVDDESHARERLRRLLGAETDVEIVGECASGRDAVTSVVALHPDLLLLDIRMPELDGFDVLRAIPPDELPLVIFVTAFDEHAIAAFDVHAVDYVLKPVEKPRLTAAIARARSRLQQKSLSQRGLSLEDLVQRQSWPTEATEANAATIESPPPAQRDPDRILVKQDGQFFAIRARDILWVESQGNYVKLNLANKRYMVRETMANLEQRLNPAQFARIHRSIIVNIDAIQEMQPWFGGDYVAILKNGSRLKASRHYKDRLDRWVLG
jgi:two-component system, LytTR family, response regulator